MTAQQTHPGFNNQNSSDPFLVPNDSEENLVAFQSDYTPSHHSYYSPTPERVLKSTNDQSSRAASEAIRASPSQSHLSNGYHTSPPPNSHVGTEDWDSSYEFLTPEAYISDNGYGASSDHTATPENEPFYLEKDFGVLDDPIQPAVVNKNEHLASNGFHPESLIAIDTARAHRYSTGTATITSSHLMSPVLTDDAGTSSRDATSSPPVQPARLKTEASSNIQINTVHQVPQYHPPQQTPPMTDSSKNTSPDLYNAAQSIARAPSPLIRVDQYARGDSPARQIHSDSRARRNRRGSYSSHLSVQATAGEEEDDEERHNDRTAHDPLHRSQISDVTVPNLQDQADASQRAFKNADVADWLDRNAPVSEANSEIPPERPNEIGRKRRARSAGAQRLSKANLESLQTTPVDTHIPGPGLLIDESGGEEESDDEDGTASIEDDPLPEPTEGMNETPGEAKPGVYDELPNQPTLYRAKLWQDPLYDSSDPGIKMQPVSSNDAIMRFQQRAADIETISRVATWGTRRRSESDMASLFRRFSLMSVKEDENSAEDAGKRDRSGSIFQRLRPRRNSTLRRKESEKQKPVAPKPPFGQHTRTSSGDSRYSRHDSLSVPKPVTSSIKRMGSLGKRPKSPRLDTGSAVAAMANPLAAVGTSGPLSTDVSSPTGGAFTAAKNVLKRSRSRSDINNVDSKAGLSNLTGLWTQSGGPPMPGLVAPKTEEPSQMAMEDDDDDDDADEPGIKMDLSIKLDPIEPTLNGFRENAKQLNPRLPHFMIERVAHEQLRRYKKLLDFKVKHVGVVQNKSCPSKKFCPEHGGEPKYLETKTKKEPDVPQTGFSVSGIGPSDEDVNALADGIVTPAQFPNGVPLPPIKRLPAEFECSLCYKVKKFHKPSDWSKHVHEDVQPFTCTFRKCADPKSFKRKADWVRHENERHRQLEWWQCGMNDCSHKCYRKDNFVQHLVREHKLPEPKYKTVKTGGKPAVRGPSAQKARSAKQGDDGNVSGEEVDQVWRMVETCKFETTKSPKEEPCIFCGNICNTWKKLTVHLAKHMEQISMPVLAIVKTKDVTPDTIISPINDRIISNETSVSPIDTTNGQPSFPSGNSLPGGFTTMGPPAGYGDPQYRTAPNTYPPPQQVGTHYFNNRGGNMTMVPETTQYNDPRAPFSHMNDPRAYAAHPTSSPDEIYTMQTSTAQATPPSYQSMHYPPQPPFAASPTEGSMYSFNNASNTGMAQQQPTSYPQPSASIYAQNTGQMNTQEQIYHQQQQQQLQSQLSGQGMAGYNVNALQQQEYGGGAGVSTAEAGGYVQASGQHSAAFYHHHQ